MTYISLMPLMAFCAIYYTCTLCNLPYMHVCASACVPSYPSKSPTFSLFVCLSDFLSSMSVCLSVSLVCLSVQCVCLSRVSVCLVCLCVCLSSCLACLLFDLVIMSTYTRIVSSSLFMSENLRLLLFGLISLAAASVIARGRRQSDGDREYCLDEGMTRWPTWLVCGQWAGEWGGRPSGTLLLASRYQQEAAANGLRSWNSRSSGNI